MSLPSGYTQLQYIRSSGMQYIDTGIAPNTNTKVAVTAETDTTPKDNEWLFGSRAASGSGRFSVFRNKATGKWGFGFGGGTTENYTAPMICTLDVYIDGTSCTINSVTNKLTGTLSSTRSIYIFKENRVGVAEQGITAKLFTFKIWNGDTLVRDYIPALRNSDNVAGLYDLQNDVFYTNAGSGVFTYPGYVEPAEGHNALIDGTAYAITGGEVLVNGAVYDVASGKTLEGGTVYTIPFTVPKIAVNITGYGSWACIARIAGVEYMRPTVLEIDAGTEIYVMSYNKNGTIKLNGQTVATATSNKPAEYTFTPDCTVVNINFQQNGPYFFITITTS